MGFEVPKLGLSEAIQAVKDAAGIVTAVRDKKGSSTLPWDSSVKSRFFNRISIESNRWDQLFPYRLLVINSKTNQIIAGSTFPGYSVTTGTGSSTITFEQQSGWIFTLPITPQQLSIQDNYAIQTSATLRGVLEEHSGVRFKLINAQGTLGVWAQRESVNKPPGSPGVIQSLFGGTIKAPGSVVSQVNRVIRVIRVISSANGNHPANKPKTVLPATSTYGETSTGYYQAIKLQQFLEQYAEAKMDPNNASWRLVFDIPKQNQSFVITPMLFTWQQNANKPLEITYNLQFKAWRRVNLSFKPGKATLENQPISPGILQRVLNTICKARKTMSAATNLIGAVRSDVEKPLDVLRQTALFVKDLAGVVITAADLPFQLQRDYASAISDTFSSNAASIQSSVSDPAVRASLNSVVASKTSREGLSMDAVTNGQLGSTAATAQSIDPSNNVFSSPEKNFVLMDQASVTSLRLNTAQQNAVDKAIEAARETTVDTLKQYRAVIQELALQLSNSFGTGDAFYSQVYGRPTPTQRIQPVSLDEYDILKQLYDVMQSYDILTATTQIDDDKKQTNMDYVAGLADLSGIPFTVTSSKILAPVPFGLTIEGIALRYLGDAQRWLEIATLNNLRAPYIDENGFQLPLLSNATGRQITVATTENIYVGQRVLLMSSSQTPSARTILGIDRLSDTSFLITLDGLPDLDNFLFSENAFMQAYLPGTVNSQQKIFIPSDLPVPDDSSIIPPPSTSADPLTGLSKVDWLLTDTGDIAVNNFGDFRYSSGITNIIQALKIKFATKAGSLLTHPNFGLGLQPGVISSDLQIQDLYNSINKMIEQDSRFQGVTNLQITLDGPKLSIGLGVSIAGQQGVFPLTFSLT